MKIKKLFSPFLLFTVYCTFPTCILVPTISSAQFNLIWTQTSNPSAGSDWANAITADGSGIYVAGHDNSPGPGTSDTQWHIEKRDLTTGMLIWTKTSNPSAGYDVAQAITSNAGGIYVAGYEYINPSNSQWRIEKRDLTTGALIPSFGTGGVIISNPTFLDDYAYAITNDASGIYVAGYDFNLSSGNVQWRIEKRDLITGSLVSVFGTGGVITSNPSAGTDIAQAITVDASGIYVAGFESVSGFSDSQWRIEKRNLTTGSLIWSQTSNPSAGMDYVQAITADASGIYAAGFDQGPGNLQWRIEKRNLTTGTLISGFGSGGVITNNPSIPGEDKVSAITADAGGIYVAGYDFIGPGGSGSYQWRVEKRDLITGLLTCSVTSNPSPGNDWAHAITSDASGIYVAGFDEVPVTNSQWRIEKYDLCTGAIFTTSITSQNIVCAGQCTGTGTAIPINGTSPYTYLWNTGGQTTSTATGLCAGTYSVIVTDGAGSTATAMVTITQPPVLTATATAANAVCGGNNGNAAVTANGGTPGYTYSWNPAVAGQTTATATGLGAGTYTVTVTDANGCDTTQIVTVVASGSVTAAATNSTICAGQVATLTASGGTNYSWNTGATTSSLTLTLTLTSASTFTVIVSSGSCSDTATATVTVTSSVTTNQSASICQGFTYTLPGGTVVSANGTYIDTLVSTAGCDSIITTTLTVVSVFTTNQSASVCAGFTYTLPGGTVVGTSGVYMDTLISVNGCDSIITTNLTVNPNPTATAFSNTTITQGQSVTLTASGGGTYSWSPATGLNCTTCAAVTVTPFWGAGGLVYCVTVTAPNNCTDSACVTVIIEPIDCSSAGELFVPNAFSPNGDGENDKLQIYYGNIQCIKNFKLVIYNRWGEKVFNTRDPSVEWDGSHRGKMENTAVFVYYLKATLISGEEIIGKGNVSILR